MGVERLAMIMFNIPDIRLFWTEDERFHKQFASGEVIEFVPYSKYPESKRDISFWVPDNYHENEFYTIANEVAGGMIEEITEVDCYTNKKIGKTSYSYKFIYRHIDRTLTGEEVNEAHNEIARLCCRQK